MTLELLKQELLRCINKIDNEQRPFIGIPEKDYYRGQYDAFEYIRECIDGEWTLPYEEN